MSKSELQINPFSESEQPGLEKEPPETVRLFHRTKIKWLPQILREGLRPSRNGIYERGYGFTTQLMDEFAPDEFKAIGLLRSNSVFAWHIAPGNMEPLTAKTITLSFEVRKSRVFIGDYVTSGNMIHGLGVVFQVAFEEELDQSRLPKLKKKTKKQTEDALWMKLFEEDIAQELLPELPARYSGDVETFVASLREKMRRYGRQMANAYWKTVMPFEEFDRRYRLDPESGKWVRYKNPVGYNAPEIMVVGMIDAKKIEVIPKSNA